MNQDTALAILKSGQNVFLTGSAGAGKTYVLNQYITYLQERNVPVAITASTGIAATHMNGMTIHAWAGIGIKDRIDGSDLKTLKTRKYMVDKMDEVKVLIIDEVSMLHRRQLDMVHAVVRYFKNNPDAFGGIQVVFSGDFFQLPPIGHESESTREKFAFMSQAWLEARPVICYLTEQYRQTDNDLNKILNEIRSGEAGEGAIEKLQATSQNEFDYNWQPTKLYTHNYDVDRVNKKHLEEIDESSLYWKAKTKGNPKLVESLAKTVLAAENLELKVGAKVMFVRNNPEKGYINGTVGEIIEWDETQDYPIPIVRSFAGKDLRAERETWSIEDESGKSLASLEQVPLRLAWAITVHKSQGMTLDSAEMDLGKTFELGQGYVALSRLKDLSGLRLLGLNEVALQVDPLAMKADYRFRELSEEAETHIDLEMLNIRSIDFLLNSGGLIDEEAIKKNVKKKKEKKGPKKSTYFKTKELIEDGMSLDEVAEERGMSKGTVVTHLIKIKELYPEVELDKFKPNKAVLTKVQKAYTSIVKQNKESDDEDDGDRPISLKSLFDFLKGKVSYEDIKQALVFVE